MAKAIVFFEYGDADVLQWIDVDEPQAGAGQLRVRVRAAGVQPFDCNFRRGDLNGYVPVQFPQHLGNEFAGIVDQVGEGVTNFAVGDAVLGFVPMIAYAEVLVVDAKDIIGNSF